MTRLPLALFALVALPLAAQQPDPSDAVRSAVAAWLPDWSSQYAWMQGRQRVLDSTPVLKRYDTSLPDSTRYSVSIRLQDAEKPATRLSSATLTALAQAFDARMANPEDLILCRRKTPKEVCTWGPDSTAVFGFGDPVLHGDSATMTFVLRVAAEKTYPLPPRFCLPARGRVLSAPSGAAAPPPAVAARRDG